MRRILGGTLAALLIMSLTPAAPAHAVSERLEQTSEVSLNREKSITVYCGGNRIAVGMGARVNGGNGGVALTGVVPGAGLGSVTAYATAQLQHSTVWSITVYAVCRYQPSLGIETVGAAAAPGTTTATATCPLFKIVVSTGFRMLNSTGAEYLTGILPSVGMTSVTVTSGGATASAIPLHAIALCAWQQQNYERTMEPGPVDSSPAKWVQAGPPKIDYGWAETFGGGAVINGSGALIDSFGPKSMLDGTVAHASRVASSPVANISRAVASTDSDDAWGLDTYGNWIGAWY